MADLLILAMKIDRAGKIFQFLSWLRVFQIAWQTYIVFSVPFKYTEINRTAKAKIKKAEMLL